MKKFYFLFGEGSKVNQIICAVLINLPVFAYGTSIGWMSPMTLLLQSSDTPRDVPLTDKEVSWMGAAAYLVCVPADFLLAMLGDKIGRKATLMLMSLSLMACWILKLSSMAAWAFVVARGLVGVIMAGSYVTCPLYTKEISQDSIRGFLGTLVILFHTIGNLFLFVIGDYLRYHVILWICLSIPVVHLILFIMMPESPSYLMKNGKEEQAAKALAWLRCRSVTDRVVVDELNMIRKEQQKDEENKGFVLKSLVKENVLFRAFRIAMMVTFAREVCGAVPVLNFAGDIFSMASKGTGLLLSPNQQAMMLGAVQVAGSALASSIVEKAGRKPLLFMTSLCSGISMCGLASWFLARDLGVSAPDWLPIATLCICIFCDSAGLQPISVVIISEIFSYRYRATVMAITMATASASDFLQMLFFKPLANAIGIYVAFYFFGIVCLINALYVLLVVPETKNRTIDDIHHDLKTKKEKLKEAEDLKHVKS